MYIIKVIEDMYVKDRIDNTTNKNEAKVFRTLQSARNFVNDFIPYDYEILKVKGEQNETNKR